MLVTNTNVKIMMKYKKIQKYIYKYLFKIIIKNFLRFYIYDL